MCIYNWLKLDLIGRLAMPNEVLEYKHVDRNMLTVFLCGVCAVVCDIEISDGQQPNRN